MCRRLARVLNEFKIQHNNANTVKKMKLKKRKIKYSAIFFVCWFAISYILIDVVLKFQTLLDYFGSFTLLETTLWLWVLVPTLAVYMLTKDE